MKDTMTTRRWNQFINLINDNRSITELEPPIQNERERQIFNNMVDELARARKVNPKASLCNVDLEWGCIGDTEGYND
jgi:hypothetical protein